VFRRESLFWNSSQTQRSSHLSRRCRPPEEAAEGYVVDYPDHTPCKFVKGKPWSIIILLISKIPLSIYVIYIEALS
jgi:hypothetical protein